MTVEQIIMIAFGAPTVALLSGIYFRLGGIQVAHEHFEKQVEKLWTAIRELRKDYAR